MPQGMHLGQQGTTKLPRPSASDGEATSKLDGPGAIRTRDLLLRRQALYPAELRTRGATRGRKVAQGRPLRNRNLPSGAAAIAR